MKFYPLLLLGLCLQTFSACAQKKAVESLSDLPPVITNAENYTSLEAAEAKVILQKGTERAFSGAFHDFKGKGVYICKQCNLPLFRSADKFDSGTGWPSFDDVIDTNVEELADADGSRTEIVCANCKGHLGHVFRGEGFTKKLTRHCANSASLNFVGKEVGKIENKQ